MNNPKLFSMLSLLAFSAVFGSLKAQDTTKRLGEYDSTRHVTRAYNKIAFQMKRFNDVVVGYIKTVKKAKPSDSNITRDVEIYSDSLNVALNNSDKADTNSMAKIRVMFDSLVKASVRLVKSVENDSALRNNKAIKQMNAMMNSLKESIDKYSQELNQSLKKKEDAEESEGDPQPTSEPEPKPKKVKK